MSATPRPPAVTLACVFVGFSAFVLLLSLVQTLSEWGTIEMQNGLEPTLTTLRERGFDLSMGELLGTLRWVGLVCVLVLVAAVVFAVYAARGDQVSRIGSTALAVLTGLLLVPFGWLGLLQAVFLLPPAASCGRPTRGSGTRLSTPRQAPRPWIGPSRRSRQPIPTSMPTPAAQPVGRTGAEGDDDRGTGPAGAKHASSARRARRRAGHCHRLGARRRTLGLYLVIYGFARDEYVTLVQDGPFADLYSAGELDDALVPRSGPAW